MKKKTTEEFIQDIQNTYGIDREDFELLTEYTGWDKPITFKCNRCGLVKTVQANSLLRKRGNKKNICRCYGYGDNWHESLSNFSAWVENQQEYKILEPFKGTRVNILVQCNSCGGVQRRSINSLTNNDKCLICENKHSVKKTPQQFDEELFELYGGEYERVGEYNGADKKVLIRHVPCGKIYSTKPHHILTNKGGHCPICKVVSKGEKAIMKFLDENKYTYEIQKRIEPIRKMPYDFYLPDYNLLIEYQGIQHFEPVSHFGGEKTFLRQKEIDETKRETATAQDYNYLEIPYTEYDNIENLLAQRLSREGVATSETTAILDKDDDIV